MEKAKGSLREFEKGEASKAYYSRLTMIGKELGLSDDVMFKYTLDTYLLEGAIIAGIKQLRNRINRCNRAYKKVLREKALLAAVDIVDEIRASREVNK